jgi:hypothetical protein
MSFFCLTIWCLPLTVSFKGFLWLPNFPSQWIFLCILLSVPLEHLKLLTAAPLFSQLLKHAYLELFKSFFFFLVVLGLKLRAFTLRHSISPIFCDGFFRDRVSGTICPGWLQTSILLISVSWVARIIGMSHLHLAKSSNLYCARRHAKTLPGCADEQS